MNLKTRLERIEKHIGDNRLLCGADLKALAAQDERNRPEAEDIFRQYVEATGDRARAVEIFSEDTPMLARSLGLRVTHPGFCRSCGSDRRTRAEQDAGLRRDAAELLERYTVAFNGDRGAALERMREHAPTLGRYLN